MVVGASIDIGSCNFSILIEEFDLNIYNDLYLKSKKIPYTKRYDSNYEISNVNWKNIIDSVCKSGKILYLNVVDISKYKGSKFHIETIINLSDYLESIKHLLDLCDFFVIERQMNLNPSAQRIEAHTYSWLAINYRDTKIVCLYGAYNKTKILGAPKMILKKGIMKKMDKPARKLWSCEKTKEILTLRGDDKNLHFIFNTHKKKADDLCDTITQLQSFKVKCFINKKL